MFQQFVKSPHGNIYLNAGVKLGLKTEIIDKDLSIYEIYSGNKVLKFAGSICSINNQFAGIVSSKKHWSYKLLENGGFNYPKTFKFSDLNDASKNSLKDQVVAKPVDGSLGKGVIIGQKSDVLKKVESLENKNKYIVQDFVEGEEYRFLIAGGKLVGILRKAQGKIIGNGKDHFENLIKKYIENNWNIFGEADEYMMEKHLAWAKRQGILNEVLEAGEVFDFKSVPEILIGYKVEGVNIKNVNPKLIQKMEECAKFLDLNLIGIDVITDLKNEENYSILEVNSAPHIDQHYIFDKEIGEKILEKLFSV